MVRQRKLKEQLWMAGGWHTMLPVERAMVRACLLDTIGNDR